MNEHGLTLSFLFWWKKKLLSL